MTLRRRGLVPHRSVGLTAALAVVVTAVALAACATAGAASCAGRAWLGAWAAPPSDGGPAFSGQTLRLNLTPLRASSDARVRLSNRFGTEAVTFDRVYLGKQRSGAALVAGSNRAVRFDGSRSVTVPAGQEVVSDPVTIAFDAFEHLAVSIYMSGSTGPATEHAQAHQTSYMTPSGAGDRSAQEGDDGFSLATTARPFVGELLTRVPRGDGVVVPVGDSITDGDQRSPTIQELGVDQDARYPDFLARRLIKRGLGFSVLNEGIGGNRVLLDGLAPFAGPSLLSRLKADVIRRRRVTDVIVMAGTNDLGQPPLATSHEVIAGLKLLVRRLWAARSGARQRLNVLVGTITPAGGAAFSTYAQAQARRDKINRFIRTSGIGDGFVDFDRALGDPDDPARLAPKYNSGDGLHPSSAGYRRLAQEVDLSRLKGPACAGRTPAR